MTPPKRPNPDPDQFPDSEDYPPATTPVVLFGEPGTLAQAQEAETLYCSAESAERTNSAKRVRFYARMLSGGGSLLEEHVHFLEDPGQG